MKNLLHNTYLIWRSITNTYLPWKFYYNTLFAMKFDICKLLFTKKVLLQTPICHESSIT